MSEKMIAAELVSNGYVKYNMEEDLLNNFDQQEFQVLKQHYQTLKIDPYSKGNRYRSYIQFRNTPELKFGFFEPYFQTKAYNPITGGVVREYPPISDEVLETQLFRQIIQHDLNVVNHIDSLPPVTEMMCGIHCFRYMSNNHMPAYSSPSWLHRDDENIVFIHLVNRSPDIVGGDNVIAESTENIEKVISLDNPMDTLVVNHLKLHAVTPMAAPDHYQTDDFVFRDIILVTFQTRKLPNE